MIDDPRVYYVENCYALRGCFHCPDCLAFALKFYKQSQLIQEEKMTARQREAAPLLLNLFCQLSLPRIFPVNLP